MKKVYKKLSTDEIADMAERGEDITQHFANKGKLNTRVAKY